eukprot:s2442_g1.t1
MRLFMGLTHPLIAVLSGLVPVQTWGRYRSSDELILVQHDRSSIAPEGFGMDSQDGKKIAQT